MTPDGQYEFLRKPFGMVNLVATLVQGLKKVLEVLSGVGSYINDTVIYIDSWEDIERVIWQAEKSSGHNPTYEMLTRSRYDGVPTSSNWR